MTKRSPRPLAFKKREVSRSLNGEDLGAMFAAATAWLEKSAASIDALNVFPVPDGDTGTNMLFTMRATLEEAQHAKDSSAGAVAQAMARGALMGARGNSGVILSQVWRGLAQSLEGKVSFDSRDLAAALAVASEMAYKAVTQPVEGTILTVIREAATAAKASVAPNAQNVAALLQATVEAARLAVARTPELLPVLRESGVVDAGGQGFLVLLEGALRFLQGKESAPVPVEAVVSPAKPRELPAWAPGDRRPYGYCTDFLLRGSHLNLEAVRQKLASLGDSLLVVGEERMLRIHLHTGDPGVPLSYAATLGTLHQITIQNMDEQHREFLAARQAKPTPLATVAVVSGEGLFQVFRSLGVTAMVPGGRTMNPSVEELLEAVQQVPSEQVILLPNNPNVVLAARQVPPLSPKKVAMVPTTSIAQGVASLLAFSGETSLEANLAAMETARKGVVTVEVTRATRSVTLKGLKVRKGEAIAFVDGELSVANRSLPGLVRQVGRQLKGEDWQLITLYYGAEASPQEAEGLRQTLLKEWPTLEVEVVAGGQPHYNYILSIE